MIGISKLVRWIYALHGPEEVASRVEEAHRRVSDGGGISYRAQRDGDQLVAATYFLRLPGRVATLGGVRAKTGAEHIAAAQVNELADELLAEDIVQCQGVSAVSDNPTKQIVAKSEFRLLTQVAHIYADLQAASIGELVKPEEVKIRPASDFSAKRLASVIAETFVGTQDCPELDGLRSEKDVLLGFLDGRQLRTSDRWEVVEVAGQPIGVLLLNPAASGVTELSYFGVSRPARGRGLGALLARRAVELSRSRGDKILAAAVDQRNLPALKTYERLGFRHHQSFDVWLHASHLVERYS